MTTTRNVGDSVGTASAKYPGWWKIDKISTTGRKLITVMPDAERGNPMQRGVQLPRELITDEPYDPAAAWEAMIWPGTVVRFVPSVLERKPDYAGLWVVTSERDDKMSAYRLGGSETYVRGIHRAIVEVVPLADLADAVNKQLAEG